MTTKSDCRADLQKQLHPGDLHVSRAQALLKPLSYSGECASDYSENYTHWRWHPFSFIPSSERMTGIDAAATPGESKTVAELREELDDYLFGAGPTASPARRTALGSYRDERDVNPGYCKTVWSVAIRRARNIPGIEAGDLCSTAYASALAALDNGTRPDKSMEQFFGNYLTNRANNLYQKSRFRDVAVAAEIRQLESQNDPRLKDEINRLRDRLRYVPLSIDALLESDDDSKTDMEMELNLAVDSDVDSRFDPEAGDRARRLNVYRLCVEACADGIEELSGVLTWVTLDYWPHIDVGDAPKQKAGLHAGEKERWAAFWFSCRDPNRFRGGSNHRQRRRRALLKISEARSRAQHLMRTSGAEL